MTDTRKSGVWGDHTRAGQPWTDDEDHKLIVWGRAVGYDFVAGHDFGREPREGTARMEWLRANKPSLIAGIETEEHRQEVAMQHRYDSGLSTLPDMRRKENRRRVH